MDRIGNVPLTPVLGVEPSRYNHVPLIATTPVLWGVWCLPADQVRPQMAAVWRTGSPFGILSILIIYYITLMRVTTMAAGVYVPG
jgi:hypothetical protein